VAEENELAPGEELEPIGVPVEDAPIPEPEEAPDPVAEIASELGWVPKEQFRGNPDEWKPAKDFIRAGKDIQKTTRRELKEVRSIVENMSRTHAALFEQQLAEKDAYWQGKLRESVDAGDLEGVEHAAQQRQKLQQAHPSQSVPPETAEFLRRNDAWFDKDPLATQRAREVVDAYAKAKRSPAEQLEAAERQVRKEFPELFPQPAKAPPSVAQPPSRAASATSRAKGFHDMPKPFQDAAREMVERGAIPNTDVYVANYFKQQRKVG
jgi:hypothetical protein